MAELVQNLLEDHIPVVKYNAVKTNKDITVGGTATLDMSASTGNFKFPTGSVTGNDGAALAATFTEINRAADVSARIVAGGSALSVTEAAHDGKVIQMDTAAGTTITLPASTGSGARFRFVITTIATSNSHKIQVANASDTMTGMLLAVSDDAGFPVKGYTADATAGADTITLNRTTTGSTVKGEWIEVIDIAANKWAVSGVVAATGTEATPFSAAV